MRAFIRDRNKRASLLALLLASWSMAATLPVIAQEIDAHAAEQRTTSPPVPLTFSLYIENDSKYVKPNHPTDRYYTNGIAISIAGQGAWADSIGEVVPFGKSFDRFALGVTAGQLMFTPRDIEQEALIEDDHPYAGYLYGGVYWQRANDNTMDHFQMDLGLVGPDSLAEDAQIWVHKVSDADEPKGWDNQLKNEVTFQTYFRKKWRLRANADPDAVGLNADLIPGVGTALGTVYIWGEAGATARIGWNLPDDFGPGRLADMGAATGSIRGGDSPWNFYGFVRVAGRAVAHNMFLEGNNFRGGPGVPIENLVGELQGGVMLGYHRRTFHVDLGYSQTVVTPEFDEQDSTHAYGAWTVAVTVLF